MVRSIYLGSLKSELGLTYRIKQCSSLDGPILWDAMSSLIESQSRIIKNTKLIPVDPPGFRL